MFPEVSYCQRDQSNPDWFVPNRIAKLPSNIPHTESPVSGRQVAVKLPRWNSLVLFSGSRSLVSVSLHKVDSCREQCVSVFSVSAFVRQQSLFQNK